MFGHEYNKLKKIREKIARRYEARLARMNEDIHIMDIFVYPQYHVQTYGEFLLVKTRDEHDHLMERLFDYIELLGNIANTYHQKYYCHLNEDGETVLRPGCRNKITRLALSEFSLFPHRPLTLKEFSALTDAVHHMAEQMLPNVHLLLSTMPVIMEDKTILNMSLYVQCGKEAKVTPFCKGSPALGDIVYYGNLFRNPSTSEYVDHMSMQVSNNTVMQIQTEGGAEYVQAVDVCLDHNYRRSEELLRIALSRDIANDHRLVPNQIDHLVTSNSTHLEHQITTEPPVQVDPVFRVAQHMNRDVVGTAELRAAGKNKYAKMIIDKNDSGIHITNPPFGSNIRIAVIGERKLGGFNVELRDACMVRNAEVVNLAFRAQVQDEKKLHDFKFINSQTRQMIARLNALERSLLAKCEDSYLQKIFTTDESQIKAKIRMMLNQHFGAIGMLIGDVVSLVNGVDTILNDLKIDIVKACDNIEYDFCTDMIRTIDAAADKINIIKSSINLRM